MTHYEDEVVVLDEYGVIIKSYRRPGDVKRIEYSSIRGIDVFEMGFWSGRFRLVGISFGRPRAWFHWDNKRRGKGTAISLDVGKWIHPTIVPEDPNAAEEILRGAVEQ